MPVWADRYTHSPPDVSKNSDPQSRLRSILGVSLYEQRLESSKPSPSSRREYAAMIAGSVSGREKTERE